MTNDEARELLQSLATPGMESLYDSDWESDIAKLEKAVSSAVAVEREACAMVAQEMYGDVFQPGESGAYKNGCLDASAAIEAKIRARGAK